MLNAHTVYADGHAETGRNGPAGCGWVILGPGAQMTEGLAGLGWCDQTRAEIAALALALRACPDAANVALFTDNQAALTACRHALTHAVPRGKWRARRGLIAALADQFDRLARVEAVHLPASAGVLHHTRADTLARTACDHEAAVCAACLNPGANPDPTICCSAALCTACTPGAHACPVCRDYPGGSALPPALRHPCEPVF